MKLRKISALTFPKFNPIENKHLSAKGSHSMGMFTYETANTTKEKCILVGVAAGRVKLDQAHEYLDELERLADTAEAEVVDRVIQKVAKYNASTLVGSGKLEEIRQLCIEHDAHLVIFDDDLSGSQAKNIEAILEEIKVIDRSALILDIFAKHARTRESKIMVEIAQMEYTMPRLTNMWTHLSRQVGGIGMRGPGESQLETDKRLVRNRVADLRKHLKKIEKDRKAQAARRNSSFHIATVGYTNAGKSTLTNRLTNAGVLVEDKLFATLDSTTRKLFLTPQHEVIVSDTVGFIRKLPHHLVASFRSTLGIVAQADLIMQVVDASATDYKDHIAVTEKVLGGMLDEEIPTLLVLNKCDALNEAQIEDFEFQYPDAVMISATENLGIEQLKTRLVKESEQWTLRQGVYNKGFGASTDNFAG